MLVSQSHCSKLWNQKYLGDDVPEKNTLSILALPNYPSLLARSSRNLGKESFHFCFSPKIKRFKINLTRGPLNLGNVQNKGYFFSRTSSLSQTAKRTWHLRWWILEFVSPITISVTIFQPVWVLVLELKCDLIRLEMVLFMARFNHFWKDERNLFEKKMYWWQEKNSTARLGAYVESATSVWKLI